MPVSVSCNNPPNPVIGQPYSHALTASGGTGPYTFALTAGSLPPGLTLSSAGNVSGTARNTGPYSYTVQATDSLSATGSVACSVSVVIPALAPAAFFLQKLTVAMKPDKHLPVRGAAQ